MSDIENENIEIEESATADVDAPTEELVEAEPPAFRQVKRPSLWKRFVKRSFDIFSSGIALILLLPFFILFTPIVAIAMKGNPFFVQRRPGRNGKIFSLIKYRTMTNAKDKEGNLLPDEDRMTKFGDLMRKLSIDELPELFNIFIGQMSVVGPRPQLVKDLVFMSEEVRQRHIVRPGLTGLAQISGRNNQTWEERFVYDLDYIEKMGFFRDLGIIFKTIGKVFARADVATDGMATAEDYGDYLLRIGSVTEDEYNSLVASAKEMLKK